MRTELTSTTVLLGIGSFAAIWLTLRLVLRKRSSAAKPDITKWRPLGILKDINLFPIKSAGALELPEAECNKFGLYWRGCRDRSLLVINDQDKIAFASVYPQMLSIKTEFTDDQMITFSAPNLPSLKLDLNAVLKQQEVKVKRVKRLELHLRECNPAHHTWFSEAILKQSRGMRLFVAVDPILDPPSWWRPFQQEFKPLMVLHQKSVDDLNYRLAPADRAHYQQFRGNLIVESGDGVCAFDEDGWLWLKIGDDAEKTTILRYNAPCLRCIFPNINVSTCKRNPNFEPLKTLQTYRLRSNPKEPEMGVYFDVYKSGHIKKGDSIYVQYRE